MNQAFHKELSRVLADLRALRNTKGHSKCTEIEYLHSKLTRLFQKVTQVDMNFSGHNPLSDMEMLSLALRASGHDRHQTAHFLETKASTIRTYEDRARKKLHAHSLNEAIYLAAKKNYLMIMREEECPFCRQHFCLKN